ncbi:5187_t:CDS:1, partial [Gigaspora margarita]
ENSIRTQLNIPSYIWKKAFKQMKDKYLKLMNYATNVQKLQEKVLEEWI